MAKQKKEKKVKGGAASKALTAGGAVALALAVGVTGAGDALDRNAQNGADDHRKDNGQHGVHTRRAKGKEHNIAANHDNVAVGEVQHLGNAVDHRIAQGDQRVNAAQTDTVDQVG